MRRFALPLLFFFALLSISSARLAAQSSADEVATLNNAPAAG
jgi:hypothetical protein